MPYINLIQEQRSRSRSNDAKSRIGFFAFAGITAVCALGWGFLFIKGSNLNSEEASLRTELQKWAPAVKQIEENRKLEAALNPKVTSLEEAQKMTDRWVSIVDHFTTQTPMNTWLTSMRSGHPDPSKAIGVTVTGMATAQEPVGEFMMRTQNEETLEGVSLRYTNEKVSPYGSVIEFEIGAEVKGTAPAILAVDEEVKA